MRISECEGGKKVENRRVKHVKGNYNLKLKKRKGRLKGWKEGRK